MKKSEIIDKLRDDNHYYGDFGKQYLSNSNIKTLLKNPLDLHKPTPSNPNFLVGGELSLDASRAHRAIEENIAKPLDIKVEEAAYDIHLIANATMIRAIRAVTSEKGRDPGDFALFAFGGSGPVHGIGIAQSRQFGIDKGSVF